MPRRTTSQSGSGFTLIEVLLAIALLILLSAGVYAFLFDLNRQRRVVADLAQDTLAASIIFGRLEQCLMTCVVGDDETGAGVRGEGSSIRVVYRGVSLSTETGGHQLADLQAAQFRWDEQAHSFELAQSEQNLDSMTIEVISRRVERLRIRYFDGTAWVDSFQSLDRGALPIAVEVAIWFFPPGHDPVAEDLAEEPVAPPPGFDLDETTMDQFESDRLAGARIWPEPDRLRVIAVVDAAEQERIEEPLE